MIKRFILATVLSISAANPALAASILYGTDNASTFKVNTANGVVTLLGSNGLSGFDADGYGSILRDLTASPSKLYGAQWNVSSAGITGAVATVDAVTGAVTSSAALTGLIETGFNQGLYSVAYDLSTSTLYGNTSRRLYTIDPTTGAATFVGDLGPGSIIGLGIDGSTGTLYSINQITDAAGAVTTFMKTLSKTNASVLSTVTLANQCSCDIAFDPLTNKGYISSSFYDGTGAFTFSGLDVLDSTATSTTFIGQHGPAGTFGMSGLAFLGATPAVPEPSTWTMMLAGFGAAGFTLRRNKRTAAIA
jgi:hypothetical protein